MGQSLDLEDDGYPQQSALAYALTRADESHTLRVQALVGNLLPQPPTALLVGADVPVLGRELALKEPRPHLGAEARLLVGRLDDEHEPARADLLDRLSVVDEISSQY